MNSSADHEIVVFAEAIQLPAHERAAYLERACGGDEELRRAVEALLQEYDQIGDFLEKSPNAPRTKAIAEAAGAEKPGDFIGGGTNLVSKNTRELAWRVFYLSP